MTFGLYNSQNILKNSYCSLLFLPICVFIIGFSNWSGFVDCTSTVSVSIVDDRVCIIISCLQSNVGCILVHDDCGVFSTCM